MHHDHHQSPSEGEQKPLSPWVVGAFMLSLFLGGLYLACHSGGFRSDVYESNAVNWAGGGAQAPEKVDPKVLGKRLYSQNCIVCHQATGLGVPGQFPPLAGSEWVNCDSKHGANHLVLILLDGHQGPMSVKGGSYNNAMPQWKQLSDEQIADILTYIRSDWGNSAAPVDAAFVASLRNDHKDQTDPWTQAELLQIPAANDAGPAPAAK